MDQFIFVFGHMVNLLCDDKLTSIFFSFIPTFNCIPTVIIHVATVQSEESHNSSEDQMAESSEKGWCPRFYV